MRKNTVLCFLAAALFLFSSIGTTFAATKVVGVSVQEIDLAGVKARIVEQYERADDVYPGNTIDKVVNVKNTGNSDCVVRVKVEKAWGETRDEDGKLIINDIFSTDNIIIEYNTEHWLYDAADGYFYYKGVLKPDETTSAPLFREFTIHKETGNEYKGFEADIIVKMECIQAAADGIGIWNKSFADLGIVYAGSESVNIVSSVNYTGDEAGFSFHPDTTDLFTNFKSLLPGETRSQVIAVGNTSETPEIEIFLRAEDIDQNAESSETLALINRLLREYATIVVADEEGTIIYRGPVWGEIDKESSNPESMRYDISLGVFPAGESKKLDIQLQLDPVMGNEYQNLLGLIKWIWTAEIPDEPVPEDTVVISGAKTWEHGNNPVEDRPTELTIYVKADDQVILTETVTAEDHWQWSFVLPKYDSDGNEIIYTIDEEPIPGYLTTINGNDVTNTHDSYDEVTINGTKTWEHGSNTDYPSSLVVHVKNGDEIVASRRITAEDNWQWSFTLPEYDENGNAAVYTVDEEPVENYTLVAADGNNLTNRFVDHSYPGDYVMSGVKTGDTMALWLWGVLTLVSVTALIIFIKNQKREKQRGRE